MVSHIAGPSLAQDLPGRGAHPTPHGEVTLGGAFDVLDADVRVNGVKSAPDAR